MVWKCPMQIFSTHICGSCRRITWQYFSCHAVVGNLTTITTQLMCDGNMIIIHYFQWHIRAHPQNKAQVYTFTPSKQLWQYPTFTTCPLLAFIGGCSLRMVATLFHPLKFVMMWFVAANMCFLVLLSIYNVLIHNECLQ